jgi:hypothetical protein
LFRVGLVTEGHKTIAKRLAIHVPHDTSFGHAKAGKQAAKDIIVDLAPEVTNEDTEVTRRVLLVLLALICPIYSDFGIEDLTAVEDLKSGFCGTHVHVLDKAIIKATVLVDAAVRDDDLDVLNWTSDGKYLREHVLGHLWAQIFHVEVGTLLLALICPIYSDFGVENLTAVEDLKSGFCGTHVHVLDKAIIKATVLVDAAVRDDLDVLNRTSDGKYLREHVLGHPWVQIFHVEVGTLLAVDTRISLRLDWKD